MIYFVCGKSMDGLKIPTADENKSLSMYSYNEMLHFPLFSIPSNVYIF